MMKDFFKFHTKTDDTRRGFTLVETLIAILIVTMAIVGPFNVAQGVLRYSYTARDQLVAASLAQEGIEYVRYIRDSNFIYNTHTGSTRPWLYGLDGSTYLGVTSPDCYTTDPSGGACLVDPSQQTVTACLTTDCSNKPALYLSGSYLYNQASSGTVTRFRRRVELKSISATETLVTVTVSWSNHGVYSIVLTETLDNWL